MQFRAAPPNYDDVTEPTEDELREIDEAIARTPRLPDCLPEEWVTREGRFRSVAVRLAIEEVGFPGGRESTIDFLLTVLAFKDAIAEVLGDFGGPDVDRFDHLACEWEYQQELQQRGELSYSRMSSAVVREMVDMLPMWVVASRFSTTTAQVERWLFPRIDLAALHAAAADYKAGTGLIAAAQGAGICDDTLARYCDLARIPRPMTRYKDGRKRMPLVVRDRIRELAVTTDLGAAEIREKVQAELPEAAEVEYFAVYQTASRARVKAGLK